MTRPTALVPLPSGARRAPVLHNGQRYRLRATEGHTLEVLATFRVVLDREVVEDVYAGRRAPFTQDLRSLTAQGLVAHATLASDRQGHHVTVITLTPAGRHLLEHHQGWSRFSSDPQRPVHAGFGKPGELVHDASLYRMYLQAASTIASQGGTIRRVILDAEWKRRLYREANRDPGLSTEARQARLVELAKAEGLPIVDGHVVLPDVRIEYDAASGDRTRADLELTTDHYHAGHISAKQQAGFTLYSAGGHAGRAITSLRGGRGGTAYDPRHLSGLLSL